MRDLPAPPTPSAPRPDLGHEPQLGRTWNDLPLDTRALVVFGAIGAGFFALLIWIGWF